MIKNKSIYLNLMGITSWQLRSKTCINGDKEKELLSNIFKALRVEKEPVLTISLNEMLNCPQLKKEFWNKCINLFSS